MDNNKNIVILIACLACLTWSSTNKMQQIDGMSSATLHNKLLFDVPISVTADSAIITWNASGSHANDILNSQTLSFSYGLGTGTLTKRTVTEQERTNKKVVLFSLTPNTTYKLRLDANKTNETPCADTATITTKPTVFVSQRFTAKKDVPLELLDHSVRLGSTAKSNDRLTIADCQGHTLLDHSVKGNERSITLPSNAKGVYLLIYSRKGAVLDKKQFVIIKK